MAAGMVCAMFAASLTGQGTKPNPKPEDYPARAELKDVTIAAENFGHGVTSEHGALFARDYVAIDVAVYSPDRRRLVFAPSQFRLRINGKTLPAEAPGAVAASIKYEDWTTHPHAEAAAGVGDTDVILGAPQPSERFPGDGSSRNRLPRPPSVGTDDPNVTKQEAKSPEEVLQRSSLPEGDHLVAPFSGFLYFPYRGKMGKIKSLELIYDGPYGAATLRLL